MSKRCYGEFSSITGQESIKNGEFGQSVHMNWKIGLFTIYEMTYICA